MTRDKLAQILANSGLLQACAAANALREGWKIDVRQSQMPYEQLASIYSFRSQRLRRMQSPHAKQLAASTEEFVANLNEHLALSGQWITISGPEEHEFIVFCSAFDKPLACLRTVSQFRVSPERWSEIWS